MSKKRFTKLATSHNPMHGLTHVVVCETCWHVSGVELLQKKKSKTAESDLCNASVS